MLHMCDPLLRVYANHQQTSRKIACRPFGTAQSAACQFEGSMSPLSCPLYVAGWRARFGEVDMLFEDIREKGS